MPFHVWRRISLRSMRQVLEMHPGTSSSLDFSVQEDLSLADLQSFISRGKSTIKSSFKLLQRNRNSAGILGAAPTSPGQIDDSKFNFRCSRCLSVGHLGKHCRGQVRCKSCFNYGRLARNCFRKRTKLAWFLELFLFLRPNRAWPQFCLWLRYIKFIRISNMNRNKSYQSKHRTELCFHSLLGLVCCHQRWRLISVTGCLLCFPWQRW